MIQELKYAEELHLEHSLSIAKWRPIPADRFLEALHGYSCDYADDHGNDGIKGTKACRVDRRGTASIYYVPKHGRHDHSIRTPVLLTLKTGTKILCFEFIEEYDPSKPLVLDEKAFLGTGDVMHADKQSTD